MKLSLLLLICSALLSWAALTLDAREQRAELVEARRTQRPAAAEAPERRIGLTVHDVSAPAPMNTTPLFRPAQTPADLAAPQPGQAFALTGVVGRAEARMAFLRDEADRQTFRVRVDDEIRGWRVERLDERCVTLARVGRRQTSCLS